MTEVRRRFEIVNRLGIHARAAAALAKLAQRFEAEIFVEKDDQRARATSVLELLMLCGQVGTVIEVSATGVDAQAAIDAVGDLVADRFGETQ